MLVKEKERKFEKYELGRFVQMPQMEPYFYNITLKPETLLESGPLAEILDIFYKHNIPILQIKSSAPLGEAIRIIIAANMKGKKDLVKTIKTEIEKIHSVENVEYSSPLFNGAAIDMWSYPPTFMGERVLIVRKSIIEEMLKEGWKRLGPHFSILLYYSYFHGALNLYCQHFQKIPRREDRKKLVKELFRLLGYGILEIVKASETEARIRVYDNIECQSLKGIEKASGGLIRGIIAGWAAGYWNAEYNEIKIREVKCITKGDLYCEYVIKRIRSRKSL